MRLFATSFVLASIAVWEMGCDAQTQQQPPGEAPPLDERQPEPGPDMPEPPPEQSGQPGPIDQPRDTNPGQPPQQQQPLIPSPAEEETDLPGEPQENPGQDDGGTFGEDPGQDGGGTFGEDPNPGENPSPPFPDLEERD